MTTSQASSVTDRTDRDAILEIRDLTVSFDMDRGTSVVVDSVDIDIHREEILGVVGESGSGKSMFASAILDAVVKPGKTSGSITYYPRPDRPVEILELDKGTLRSARWTELSMVFQGAMSSWNPTMRIDEHFKETIVAHGDDVDERMAYARELLSDLYLDPERVLQAYPHELSGGMKQRTLIALSMVLEPKILVMDEPTAALDLLMQRSILRMLRELQQKYEITLIFITHDLPLVARLADRLAVMYAFEFIEVAPPQEILYEATHPYTRALLNATPNLGIDPDDMQPIEGSPPDSVEALTGCSYHPRCPLGDRTCVDTAPPMYDVDGTHEVACHYWEDIGSIPALELPDRGETQ